MRIVVCGNSSSRMRVGHFVRRELVAAAGREHGIEHQRNVGIVGNDFRDGGDALEAPQHADLECVDGNVLEQTARLVGHPLGLDRLDASTPRVSCTVIAVTTDNGWQPMLANVRMSACRPAPPEGSDAANVSTMGGNSGSVSAGMARPLEAAERGGIR